MKVCEKCGDEIFTKDGENRCKDCEKKKRKKNTLTAAQKRDIMESLGLERVVGARGGVYYE
jgi:uncharacterized Zn finger protein (UPF0148 family)